MSVISAVGFEEARPASHQRSAIEASGDAGRSLHLNKIWMRLRGTEWVAAISIASGPPRSGVGRDRIVDGDVDPESILAARIKERRA